MNTFITIILAWTVISPLLGEVITRWQTYKQGVKPYRTALRENIQRLKQHELTPMDGFTIIEPGMWSGFFNFQMGGAFYWRYKHTVFITRDTYESLGCDELASLIGHELTHKKYQDRPYGYGLISVLFVELRADLGCLKYSKAENMFKNIVEAMKIQREILSSEAYLLSAVQLFTVRQQMYNTLIYLHLPRLIMLKIYQLLGK